MLRFRRCDARALAAALPLAAVAPRRAITSRGQYNPIHNFDVMTGSPQAVASTDAEFLAAVTNPGPLRVGYSADYLDWMRRAYRAKVQYLTDRERAERIFNGHLLTSTGAKDAAGDAEDEEAQQLPGAPPPGMHLRPPHSTRRQAGEAKRRAAQRALDDIAVEQGMLDLFERQPQFPVIHLDRATRFHVVELFKELVLDRALEPEELWDKALLYRAILLERRASYPKSFDYIAEAADAVVLSSPQQPHLQAVADRCPSVDDATYFRYLVKRYVIDNAVEGHVVLRCHREPNASELLFCNPPPKDDGEVRRQLAEALSASAASAAAPADAAADGADKRKSAAPSGALNIRVPPQYPPISALWRCEENYELLRVLVFGELNLIVSENPFSKFTRAQAFITRPYSTDNTAANGANNAGNTGRGGYRGGGRRDDNLISLANIISERRGHLAPLHRNLSVALDARAGDLRRLEQRHHREDNAGFQKLLRQGSQGGAGGGSGGGDPNASDAGTGFTSYADWSYFNPRAVRAETRDRLQRAAVKALYQYEEAGKDLYRADVDTSAEAAASRPTEGFNTMPAYVPTGAHFTALIKKDPHVAFLQHAAGLPEDGAAAGRDGRKTPTRLPDGSLLVTATRLEKLVVQLALTLQRWAASYDDERARRVRRRAVDVAAAMLDQAVADAWRQTLQREGEGSAVARAARRLGAFRPFEKRPLDKAGFSTDARMDDYERWTAPAA